MTQPRLETLAGAALLPALPGLARLRCQVFAEWPYRYAGDEASEAAHLASFAETSGAAVVLAWAGADLIGAATCQPLPHALPAIRAPFTARGLDPAAWCYFGESVLLPAWRGQGLGVAFFTHREAHARALGLHKAAFCAVVRNPNDPRTPPGYQPLDPFWQKRGYTRRPELSCVLPWREAGDAGETPHSLVFWAKETL